MTVNECDVVHGQVDSYFELRPHRRTLESQAAEIIRRAIMKHACNDDADRTLKCEGCAAYFKLQETEKWGSDETQNERHAVIRRNRKKKCTLKSKHPARASLRT